MKPGYTKEVKTVPHLRDDGRSNPWIHRIVQYSQTCLDIGLARLTNPKLAMCSTGCRFGPINTMPSWLGRLPGTIGGTTHIYQSSVIANCWAIQCRFGPSDTIPSWVGIMPGTITGSSIKRQAVTAQVMQFHARRSGKSFYIDNFAWRSQDC